MTEHIYSTADFPPGLLAIPAQDQMWTDSAFSFLELSHTLPPGSCVRVGRQSSSPAWNRNRLTEEFLRDAPTHGWEWILFVDSDMVVPPATALRLLSHGSYCVGALYYSRREPPIAEFNRVGEPPADPVNGLLPVRWVGAGCLMVKKCVLDTIPEPWFEHPNPGEGEDLVFSAKVKAAGFQVCVDIELQVGHMTSHVLTKRDADIYFASPEGKARMAIATAGSEAYQKRTNEAVANALQGK